MTVKAEPVCPLQWIAVSTALYLAHALVADASEEFALSTWLDYFVSPKR